MKNYNMRIDVFAIHLGNAKEIAHTKKILNDMFRGDIEKFTKFYGFKVDAPILKQIV